jgi:N-acetylmuramoyl-L-alanine amidase
VGVLLLVVLGAVVLPHGTTSARRPPRRRAPGSPIAAAPTQLAVGSAADTCLAYPPTQGNRHQTVFVDPGHGGADSGTSGVTSTGRTVYEKDLTVATGLDLLPLLRGQGYRVVMSRVDDRLLVPLNATTIDDGSLTVVGEHDDGVERIACANAAQASVLVAIHFDAFSDPTVGGAETLYDSARSFGAANLRLGELVQQALITQFAAAGWKDVPDRGVTDDGLAGTPAITAEGATYGHVLELGPAAPSWLAQPSTMPGVFVEPLFLSEPAEADIAASVKGQQAIAHALADSIDAFLAPAAPATRTAVPRSRLTP